MGGGRRLSHRGWLSSHHLAPIHLTPEVISSGKVHRSVAEVLRLLGLIVSTVKRPSGRDGRLRLLLLLRELRRRLRG